MYFDSHAHLDDRRFGEDREQIFRELKDHNVSRIMNVGCDLPSSQRSIALAEEYEFVYASVGSLGVQLPVSQTAAYFLVLVVYGILELALHAWKKPYVDLTYAMAYDEIYQEFAAEHLNQPE